jgi:hypothetical protein
MNARRIINTFKNAFTPHVKTPLGRWNIHNQGETSLKIQYATEDNCGIYSHNYKNMTARSPQQIESCDDEKYIYMMGYDSVHR